MQSLIKSQIITLRDWSDIATALIRQFIHTKLEEEGHDPDELHRLTEQWTIDSSLPWVWQMLDDEFSRQMKWSANADIALDGLAAFLGEMYVNDFGPQSNSSNESTFIEELIYELDPITIAVGEFVHSIVSPNPWWVWSVHMRGDVVLIESGEDYRIKLFHDVFEKDPYTWSLPTTID